MDPLQVREKEIFEAIRKIKQFKFVVIGGYAVNAYTLPRFSVDCDIVVEDDTELKNIEKELEKISYLKIKSPGADLPYHGKFVRYEKRIDKNFKVSMDILVGKIIDRQTGAAFSARWAFDNSALKALKGKTILEELKTRIVDVDALIAMKFISCRKADIRDVFMLLPQARDSNWIKEEISKRYDFQDRFTKIKEKITSPKFKDDLQGVFGCVDEKVFEKHKKAVLRMG